MNASVSFSHYPVQHTCHTQLHLVGSAYQTYTGSNAQFRDQLLLIRKQPEHHGITVSEFIKQFSGTIYYEIHHTLMNSDIAYRTIMESFNPIIQPSHVTPVVQPSHVYPLIQPIHVYPVIQPSHVYPVMQSSHVNHTPLIDLSDQINIPILGNAGLNKSHPLDGAPISTPPIFSQSHNNVHCKSKKNKLCQHTASCTANHVTCTARAYDNNGLERHHLEIKDGYHTKCNFRTCPVYSDGTRHILQDMLLITSQFNKQIVPPPNTDRENVCAFIVENGKVVGEWFNQYNNELKHFTKLKTTLMSNECLSNENMENIDTSISQFLLLNQYVTINSHGDRVVNKKQLSMHSSVNRKFFDKQLTDELCQLNYGTDIQYKSKEWNQQFKLIAKIPNRFNIVGAIVYRANGEEGGKNRRRHNSKTTQYNFQCQNVITQPDVSTLFEVPLPSIHVSNTILDTMIRGNTSSSTTTTNTLSSDNGTLFELLDVSNINSISEIRQSSLESTQSTPYTIPISSVELNDHLDVDHQSVKSIDTTTISQQSNITNTANAMQQLSVGTDYTSISNQSVDVSENSTLSIPSKNDTQSLVFKKLMSAKQLPPKRQNPNRQAKIVSTLVNQSTLDTFTSTGRITRSNSTIFGKVVHTSMFCDADVSAGLLWLHNKFRYDKDICALFNKHKDTLTIQRLNELLAEATTNTISRYATANTYSKKAEDERRRDAPQALFLLWQIYVNIPVDNAETYKPIVDEWMKQFLLMLCNFKDLISKKSNTDPSWWFTFDEYVVSVNEVGVMLRYAEWLWVSQELHNSPNLILHIEQYIHQQDTSLRNRYQEAFDKCCQSHHSSLSALQSAIEEISYGQFFQSVMDKEIKIKIKQHCPKCRAMNEEVTDSNLCLCDTNQPTAMVDCVDAELITADVVYIGILERLNVQYQDQPCTREHTSTLQKRLYEHKYWHQQLPADTHIGVAEEQAYHVTHIEYSLSNWGINNIPYVKKRLQIERDFITNNMEYFIKHKHYEVVGEFIIALQRMKPTAVDRHLICAAKLWLLCEMNSYNLGKISQFKVEPHKSLLHNLQLSNRRVHTVACVAYGLTPK